MELGIEGMEGSFPLYLVAKKGLPKKNFILNVFCGNFYSVIISSCITLQCERQK